MSTYRLSCLEKIMSSNHLDAIALNPGSTLTYLTGLNFHLMERPTVFLYKRGCEPVLILPELEAGKIKSASLPLYPFTFGDDPSGWQNAFTKAVEKLNLNHMEIGVEPARLRYLELDFLQKAAPDSKFKSADLVLSDLRILKSKDEISCMREAVKIAQNALTGTLPFLKAGVSEKEIASELIIQTFRAGSSPELPFSPIVAGGPNSANPHAIPTDRKFQQGDLIVIDWGAGFNDYFSDLTRTFALGEISPRHQQIYETVQAANQAGRSAGKVDIPAGSVDLAARTVIDNAGYGKFFTHRTGHGLGMEAHEPPYIFGENTMRLREGMVYTIEPGIYLPEDGGVRIEDDVVVTADGAESLSDFSRDLLILN